MEHSHLGPYVLTHGLQHVSHVPCEDEVTLMSHGAEGDSFLSRSGRIQFYTADRHLRDPPSHSTVPYEGITFTRRTGKLVGWGASENLSLLDRELLSTVHNKDTPDIRACQLLCNEDLYNPVPDLSITCTISKSYDQRTESSDISEVTQDQTNDPELECLLERTRDLCSLQSGDTHSRRKPTSTPHTRREAFKSYYQLLYKPPVHINIPDDDDDDDLFDMPAALFTLPLPTLRPLTPPILQEGFFPNWSLAKKPDATHTQEGVPSRPTTASLGFIPNSVAAGRIWPEEVVENNVTSSPWTLRDEQTHDPEERTMDDRRCSDKQEDDESDMNPDVHPPKTPSETHSLTNVTPTPLETPPPPVTPPPDYTFPKTPKFTLKPLKPLPPIKLSPPPTPPILAPPSPVHTPLPPLPDFLKQFLQEDWFHNMFPEPGSIPKSLSLTEFCALLLDFLKRCVMDQKLCVLKAIITLHTHNSLTITHTSTHSLLDTLHTCLHRDMSDPEQHFVVELLNFLVFVNPHSFDIIVEILVLLADKQLRLQSVAVTMLQALGVGKAQKWLRPLLESWGQEVQKHVVPLKRLRERAYHWLNSWTTKYKIHRRDRKQALQISPSEVLRYFCLVQKEAEVKLPSETGHRKDNVKLDTHLQRWKVVHRLGETNSMTRIREPQGSVLPPLMSRPVLTGFPRLLSLPLPRVTVSPFPWSLTARCLNQIPARRYFLLERSYVQFYR